MLSNESAQDYATTLRDWNSYLRECGILANPFSRSQWDTNRSTLLRAVGFSDTGATMHFTISDKIRSGLQTLVSRANNSKTSKTEVAVISSLPGGGKTRLLLELLDVLPDFEALYYVSFNLKSPPSAKFDTMEDLELTERSIAMRILYQAILVHSRQNDLSFREWLRELYDRRLEDIFTIKDAIKLLGGDPQKKSVVAVDEANKLKERGTTTISAEMQMANLIGTLGQTMNNSQIFSFMAGTLIGAFTTAAKKSGTGIVITYLSLLTFAQQAAILDSTSTKRLAGWRCQRKARILLSELGGLPRLIEVFINEIIDAQNGVAFDNISWSDVERNVKTSRVAKTYHWEQAPELARPLVDAIMLRKQILPNWHVFPEYPTTYEFLQQNSQIVLQECPHDENVFIPTMPLMAFRMLVKTAKAAVVPKDDVSDRFEYLCNFLDSSPDTWQAFESFAIRHTNLINSFFANADQDTWLLSRRYNAIEYGDAKDINITFLTKHPRMISCHKQFPKSSSIVGNKTGKDFDFADGNCYRNAPGARFGDGFYVCDEAVDDSTTDPFSPEDEEMDNDDDSGPVQTRSRPIKLHMVEQYKDLQGNMTFAKCIDEHEKNLESWDRAENIESKDDYRLITALISTGKVAPPEKDERIPPRDLLVVDRTNFKVFYGVLEPLLCRLPSTDTNRLAINTATWDTLKKTFGEAGADTLRDLRSHGFRDRSDLEARLSRAGKSTKEWKHGWSEALDICEF